jgi:hypothetical protein
VSSLLFESSSGECFRIVEILDKYALGGRCANGVASGDLDSNGDMDYALLYLGSDTHQVLIYE